MINCIMQKKLYGAHYCIGTCLDRQKTQIFKILGGWKAAVFRTCGQMQIWKLIVYKLQFWLLRNLTYNLFFNVEKVWNIK